MGDAINLAGGAEPEMEKERGMEPMSAASRTLPFVALPLLLVVTGATAQQLDLQSPAPERSIEGKSQSPEQSQTRAVLPQADLYPHRPALPYDPRFIEPLTKETPTGRVGAAGWTSPNTSVGSRQSSDPENPGWLGLGLAIEWGGPRKTMTP